jgi:hypothetical protein
MGAMLVVVLLEVVRPAGAVGEDTVLARVVRSFDTDAWVADARAADSRDARAAEADDSEAEMEASMTNCGSSSIETMVVDVKQRNIERTGDPVHIYVPQAGVSESWLRFVSFSIWPKKKRMGHAYQHPVAESTLLHDPPKYAA